MTIALKQPMHNAECMNSQLLWAKESRSEKQITDVRNLIQSGVKIDYLEEWTQKLGIDDLFEECCKEREQ